MLKKILIGLVLTSLVVGLVLPQLVLANDVIPKKCNIRRDPGLPDEYKCPAEGADCDYTDEDIACGLCCLMSTIYFVTDTAFLIMMLLVMIFVLMGAFNILTAAGNADKINAGRNYIMYAAIGLAIALFARAVPALVKWIVIGGAT